MKTLSLKIGGMNCASCASTIEAEVKKISGVQSSRVNYAVEVGRFEIIEEVSESAVIKTIKSLGFSVEDRESGEKSLNDDQKIKEKFYKIYRLHHFIICHFFACYVAFEGLALVKN